MRLAGDREGASERDLPPTMTRRCADWVGISTEPEQMLVPSEPLGRASRRQRQRSPALGLMPSLPKASAPSAVETFSCCGPLPWS